MNPLSKIQVLMVGFLLLLFATFLYDFLLVIPAVVLFLLQFPMMRGELKREYPEDWMKYSLVFMIYEIIMVLFLYAIINSRTSLFDIGAIYNILIIMIFIIITTIILKFFVGRGYCYGDVLFSTNGWVGVRIKNDLFSKINEANYAVENPLEVGVKKGDRVKIRVRSTLNKSVPYEIAEAVK